MAGRLRRIAASDGLSGRFSRYLVVGGSAAVVDLGGFVLLRAIDIDVAPAAVASFVLSAIYNYALSALVVFRVPPTWRRFALFGAFASVGLLVNTGATVAAATHLPSTLAKVAGIGLAFGVNFWMNNAVVFHRRRAEARPGDAE